MSMSETIQRPILFDNSYARLPEHFFARLPPTPVASPRLIKLNCPLAELLNLDVDWLASSAGLDLLAGNRMPQGAEPLAQAYAGHQFGGFVPQLGDGRANLLGEVFGRDGRRRDIQLKGSGPTPFSRRGDGRAALGPVLREYLVSEAMAALGIPTTRALAAVTTGEFVRRETMLPGAVLTRIAASHIRVGTFQYFAARGDTEALRTLAHHAIARHDPDAADAAHPIRAFLDGVVARQADLVARWMSVGFIHGVMNTDNTSVSGETIDYGPCAFMDAYDPNTVFSSIDEGGRYAYANQAPVMLWNLARLAETLLPLLADDEDAALASAREALAGFRPRFEAAHLSAMRRKLGLANADDGDPALISALLERMAVNHDDFTATFRSLCGKVANPHSDGDEWSARWAQRLDSETTSLDDRLAAMRTANPVYIPRNHLVEAAIQAAVTRDDFGPFETLNDILARPGEERPGLDLYAMTPREDERVLATFCGT